MHCAQQLPLRYENTAHVLINRIPYLPLMLPIHYSKFFVMLS